jgi:hypothetical protein
MTVDEQFGTDGAHPIDDFTTETLDRLAGRITSSRAEEEFVYREAELDDLWRIVETALTHAEQERLPAVELDHLRSLLRAVRRAHDLVGHGHPEADPEAAAHLLRAYL